MAGVDPYLRVTMEFLVEELFPEGPPSPEALKEVRFPFLMRVTDEWISGFDRGNYPDLVVETVRGDILGCTGSPLTFDALVIDSEVLAMEFSRQDNGPECGVSIPFVGADSLHRSPLAEKGDGCLVGVIDDGVDVLHPAFTSASGSTRILAYWDQTAGRSLGCAFGTLWTSHDINAILKSRTATSGSAIPMPNSDHGTHVASIAVGSRTAGFSGGVAPEANIIAVRMRRSKEYGSPVECMKALDFIHSIASQTDLPLVVNMSFGLASGARDGQTLFETSLENDTKQGTRPGLVYVTSAGNEYRSDKHAHLYLPPDSSDGISWETDGGAGRTHDSAEFWMSPAPDLAFEIEYNDQIVTSLSVAGAINLDKCMPDGNKLRISSIPYHHVNGLAYVLVSVGSVGGNPITPARLKISYMNDSAVAGNVHAWCDHTRNSRIRFTSCIAQDVTLTCPATAENVIAVGSCFPDNLCAIAGDSSAGPTRDGRHKPDLIAPGQAVEAAGTGGKTAVVQSGTSQAAAHVTGAAALILSLSYKQSKSVPSANMRPFSSRQVRSILTSATKSNSGLWHNRTGHGCLDIASAARRLFKI